MGLGLQRALPQLPGGGRGGGTGGEARRLRPAGRSPTGAAPPAAPAEPRPEGPLGKARGGGKRRPRERLTAPPRRRVPATSAPEASQSLPSRHFRLPHLQSPPLSLRPGPIGMGSGRDRQIPRPIARRGLGCCCGFAEKGVSRHASFSTNQQTRLGRLPARTKTNQRKPMGKRRSCRWPPIGGRAAWKNGPIGVGGGGGRKKLNRPRPVEGEDTICIW